MLKLKNVTLISVDGRGNEKENIDSIKSLSYSSENIEFGSIKFISCLDEIKIKKNIDHIKINKMTYKEYSTFIIKNLYDYINTDYVLIIQNDGFVLNANFWDNKFLEYDYIGAPWVNHPHYNYIRVGNGGFSLRSKKFLEICKYQCSSNGFNEDHEVCIKNREIFLSNGIKYAPVEIAMKFSLELPIDECEFDLNKTFGFHGDKILSNKILNNVKII